MKKEIISYPNEKPKLKVTWWAMILSFCSASILILLPFFASLIRPLLDHSGDRSASIGLNFGLASPVLAIAALVISVIAFVKGERSWVTWVGLILSIMLIGFWIFFIVASILDGLQY
jgi:hypothetical protein